MNLHLRYWVDHIPGWLVAALALCGLLAAAVNEHALLPLSLLGLAAGLAAHRFRSELRNLDVWTLDEWVRTRKAAFGIREWLSPYRAAAIYCNPVYAKARDDAAREMNLMMMELIRGGQKTPADASMEPLANASIEPSGVNRQSRFETAQVRHEQCNVALGRELTAQLADGQLMAKGLPVSEGSSKSERVIATSRWRLLELNLAKAEAHGPAGEYAGIVIGKPTIRSPAERKPAAKSPQTAAPRQQPPSPARPPVAGERPAPGRR